MHNQGSILKNEMHKIFWDYEIQTDHLISARQPDLVIVKKMLNSELCSSGRLQSKKRKENGKWDKYLDLAREQKKSMEYEGDSDTNCNRCAWNNPQRFGKGTRKLKNQRTRRDHPNYSIIKTIQNTEKSPGGLRRLAVAQTPVNYNQLIKVNIIVQLEFKLFTMLPYSSLDTTLQVLPYSRKKMKQDTSQNNPLCWGCRIPNC